MAYIMIKSDQRKRQENKVMGQMGGNAQSVEHCELVECITARSNEAVTAMRKEGRRIIR